MVTSSSMEGDSMAPGAASESSAVAHFPDHYAALRQLINVLLRRHRLVRREHAGLSDLTPRLHLTGDRKRISRRALHRADARRLVVIINHFPANFPGLAGFRPLGEYPQRNQVLTVGFGETR